MKVCKKVQEEVETPTREVGVGKGSHYKKSESLLTREKG